MEMILDLRTLLEILPDAQPSGLSGHEQFDLINIAHLKQFESLPHVERTLYFCVYEDFPDDAGWYKYSFDRSLNIDKLKSDARVVFVIDDRVPFGRIMGTPHIRVNSIFRAVDLIRQYVLDRIRPRVVGVTGSVGKTTTAALLQHVLATRFGCGRVYSKRLTPLTLSSWLVNFLEEANKMLVLEYSMYRKNHIGILTNLLPPEIGIFLNVRRMHLGVEGVHTLDDIIEGKRALVDGSRLAILNVDDQLVLSLRRKQDLMFSLRDSDADAFLFQRGDEATVVFKWSEQRITFAPYLKTDLFYRQVLATCLTASALGIPQELLREALNTFHPAENRIGWVEIDGQRAIFDGDVTAAGRLASLAEHRYSSSVLMVHSFDFGDENVELQQDDFNRVFSAFTVVRVLDTEENRAIASRYSLKHLIFTTKKEFCSGLNKFEFKILHFATYLRKHADLSFLKSFIAT